MNTNLPEAPISGQKPRNPWKESALYYFREFAKRGIEIIELKRKIAGLENELRITRRLLSK
jgi:hypothetical protein